MTSSRYRWVIVTAGGLLGCVAIGGMFSLPVFLQPLVGASTAAIFAPMMATVTGWFDIHRSLAVSLVSYGMGMAPMTMSPLAAWLVSNHGWRTSMQIVALVVGAIMIPVSLLVRRAPALDSAPAPSIEGGAPPSEMSL